MLHSDDLQAQYQYLLSMLNELHYLLNDSVVSAHVCEFETITEAKAKLIKAQHRNHDAPVSINVQSYTDISDALDLTRRAYRAFKYEGYGQAIVEADCQSTKFVKRFGGYIGVDKNVDLIKGMVHIINETKHRIQILSRYAGYVVNEKGQWLGDPNTEYSELERHRLLHSGVTGIPGVISLQLFRKIHVESRPIKWVQHSWSWRLITEPVSKAEALGVLQRHCFDYDESAYEGFAEQVERAIDSGATILRVYRQGFAPKMNIGVRTSTGTQSSTLQTLPRIYTANNGVIPDFTPAQPLCDYQMPRLNIRNMRKKGRILSDDIPLLIT